MDNLGVLKQFLGGGFPKLTHMHSENMDLWQWLIYPKNIKLD